MRQYELALIVSAKIKDDEREATVNAVKDLIGRFDGTVTEVDEWGKKKLAYEIQKMPEGFYYFIRFEADGTTPSEVEQRLRIMDNILRFLIVKKEEE